MKRVCSVLLVLCLMLSFTACGETAEPEENGVALPFGLTFGMTYDEFAAKLSENGLTANPLKPASNNDGYFPDGVELPVDDPAVWEFLGSETLKKYAAAAGVEATDPLYIEISLYSASVPYIYVSFNQNKELYELYIVWYFYSEELAQTVCTELSATYDAFFGTSGKKDAVTAEWRNEEYEVHYGKTGEVTYMLTIHDFTHDLEN